MTLVNMMVIAAAAAMPSGLPYSATPLPQKMLQGLETHAWGRRDGGLIFRVDGVGTGLLGIYLHFRGSSDITWMWQRVYFTRHAGVDVMSHTDGSGNGLNVDPPKSEEACFAVRAIQWTQRHVYWRELDATATLHANPWLDHRQTGDPFCPVALGHLSAADQARLTLRWRREHSLGVAPAPPPTPAIGAPRTFDPDDHPANESALKHR